MTHLSSGVRARLAFSAPPRLPDEAHAGDDQGGPDQAGEQIGSLQDDGREEEVTRVSWPSREPQKRARSEPWGRPGLELGRARRRRTEFLRG